MSFLRVTDRDFLSILSVNKHRIIKVDTSRFHLEPSTGVYMHHFPLLKLCSLPFHSRRSWQFLPFPLTCHANWTLNLELLTEVRRQIRGLNVASPLQTDQVFNTSMTTASVQSSNHLDLSFLTLQEPRDTHKLMNRQSLQILKLIIIVRIVCCVCMCSSRVQLLAFPFRPQTSVNCSHCIR
jgi:hypothetical protein